MFKPPAAGKYQYNDSTYYKISNSVRLRASVSAYFSRTPGIAGNRRTWTWSGWVKRGRFATDYGIYQQLFGAYSASTGDGIFFTNANDQLALVFNGLAGNAFTTTSLFRDPSAWYHVVVAVDTTSAMTTITGGSTDRCRCYVNGVQIASFVTINVPPQNFQGQYINNTVVHEIGRNTGSTQYYDGYLSDVYFIDGQALTPSSFGQFSSNGVWVPKAYTGTYGTNGFHLDFKDAASTTTLGYDVSGNANHWTPGGSISVTTGVTYDSMVDTPTNNYATLNPLQRTGGTAPTNGGLTTTSTTLRIGPAIGTIGVDATNTVGYYFEIKPSAGLATNYYLGIANIALDTYNKSASIDVGYIGIITDGTVYANGTSLGVFTSYTSGDVLGFCIKNGNLYISKNGTAMNSGNAIATGITGNWTAWSSHVGSTGPVLVADFNFGQRGFDYPPLPANSKPLCTANL